MSQSLAQIVVHIVFGTKNRSRFINMEIEKELHAYIATVLREHESPAIIINGTADHIHILCRLSRTISVSRLLEKVKWKSSRWIKKKGQRISSITSVVKRSIIVTRTSKRNIGRY